MKSRKSLRGFGKNCMIIIAVVLMLGLTAACCKLYALAVSVYDSSFNYRYTTKPGDMFELSDFPVLTRERHTIISDKGQQLAGYMYHQSDDVSEKKGVVVFSHGLGGGGQTGYMDIFNYLTESGYYVFAYDATGNDESEGAKVGGLPQGYIDLDYVLDYVYTLDEVSGLPVVLMGYSWGAFSAVNVLNYHPEVEAVVAMAGWNRSLDLIKDRGIQKAGDKATLLIPFAAVYEYKQYGNYAFSTAMKGFEKSNCNVMIIHGELDSTVPIVYGYDTYYEKYKDSERFLFKKYPQRRHDVLDNADGTRDFELMAEIADFLEESLK